MSEKRTSVLVVAAHPDDEVLGCGGTIARLAGEGEAVYAAILGEGITSRQLHREDADYKEVERLEAQSRKAAALLGVKEVFYSRLPDNRFDTIPLLDIVKAIEKLIEKLSPHVIYTHHTGDLNIDHSLVNRAVITAARPMPGASVREILAFEVPSSTEWAFGVGPRFTPNVYSDVSETLSSKIEAMHVYDGEERAFPHPRSSQALSALATYRGATVGLKAAEAFELVRSIR